MLCCEKGERYIYIEKVFIVVKLCCAELHVFLFYEIYVSIHLHYSLR